MMRPLVIQSVADLIGRRRFEQALALRKEFIYLRMGEGLGRMCRRVPDRLGCNC